MPIVEFAGGDEPLALLVHLMSAGRLQVFDKRASMKDRASRVLVRLADGRELRLREFGTKQRAWAKLLRRGRGRQGRDGRDARPRGLAGAAARRARRGRSTSRATSTRCCATSARSPASAAPGSTRSSGRRSSRPSRRAPSSKTTRSSGLTTALHVLGDAIDHYEEVVGERSRTRCRCRSRSTARGRALPALRHDDRGRLLLRAPDELLPGGADRRQGAQGPPALAAAEVAARFVRSAGPRAPAASRALAGLSYIALLVTSLVLAAVVELLATVVDERDRLLSASRRSRSTHVLTAVTSCRRTCSDSDPHGLIGDVATGSQEPRVRRSDATAPRASGRNTGSRRASVVSKAAAGSRVVHDGRHERTTSSRHDIHSIPTTGLHCPRSGLWRVTSGAKRARRRQRNDDLVSVAVPTTSRADAPTTTGRRTDPRGAVQKSRPPSAAVLDGERLSGR